MSNLKNGTLLKYLDAHLDFELDSEEWAWVNEYASYAWLHNNDANCLGHEMIYNMSAYEEEDSTIPEAVKKILDEAKENDIQMVLFNI